MNTQVYPQSPTPGIPAAAPSVPADEVLTDYPSEYITGLEERPFSLEAYTLTPHDIKYLFEELLDMVKNDSRGDVDGERYELDYKAFRIEAVHHYQCHEERGGDSYCGVCESYGIIDVDSIEVVRVFDEDGQQYPELVKKLNEYANNQ